MTFSFDSTALLTATQLSKFFFNCNDATTGLTPALTTQQIFSIELIVNALSTQIKSYVDSAILSDTYTEVWDGAASDEIVPRERPITAISSIKFSGNGNFSSVSALDSSVYTFDRWAIKFLQGMATPRGRGLVQVVYTAGYSVVPNDILLAALLQFQWAYRQIGRGDSFVGIKSIHKMGESQTKDDTIGEFGLRQEVVGLLKPYMRFEAPLSIMFSRVS